MQPKESPSVNDKSMGSLFRELTEHLSTLVRSEVALAKLEMRQTAAKLGAAGALFGGAAFLALCGVVFLIVAIILALSLVISAWLATLIVGVVVLGAAFALFGAGKEKMSQVEFVPTETIDSIKTDVETIRSEILKFRQRGEDVEQP